MRRSKTTGTDTTNYLYDGISTVRETDGQGALTNSYTTDPTRLVGHAMSRTDSSDVTSFYSVDGLGSTRNLTDIAQNQTAGYSYDAFGNLLNHTGDDATYTFSTKEQDTTGLYYFAARYYDPETGRFITQDPYPANLFDPQSLNRYVYCENNPINFVDPLGLCKDDAFERYGTLGFWAFSEVTSDLSLFLAGSALIIAGIALPIVLWENPLAAVIVATHFSPGAIVGGGYLIYTAYNNLSQFDPDYYY